MSKNIAIILFLIFNFQFSIFNCQAQTVAQAQDFFNAQRYAEAAEIYEKLLAKKPKDDLSNYRLARCWFELGQWQRAVPHFEAAKEKYTRSYYYLALYYDQNWQFAQAKAALEGYLKNSTDSTFSQKVREMLPQIALRAEMITRIEDIALIDSVVVDKSSFLSAYSQMAADLGTVETGRTNVGAGRALPLQQTIKYTTQRGDRTIFSQQVDGQFDIFTSYRLADKWSAPVPISSEINTAANENYPFLLTDGVTLYFASDGEKSIGGYDIFFTRFNPDKNEFYPPENVGMPFNSPYNDYMLVVDEGRGIGWFASDRFQPEGKVIVYRFVPNREKKIIRATDPDSIRAFAELRLARVGVENVQQPPILPEKTHTPDFEFVINNRTVYHSLSDFKTQEASALFQTYETQQQALAQLQIDLEQKRRQYASAESSEKNLIAPHILQLEQQIAVAQREQNTLQQKIRNLETSVK